MKEENKRLVKGSAWLGGITGLLYGIDPNGVSNLLTEAANSKMAQYGFLFTLAAWIHSGRVKKEIASSFIVVSEAINNVAEALKKDLRLQAERLEHLENISISLTTRVEQLETSMKE